MDRPDYPQDEQPGIAAGPAAGAESNVPSLIHDYKAQRAAWREQARNLARMREEVLAAADHEARDIVSSARADIRRILLKARRDLIVLAAQVRAAGRLGDAEETPDTVNFLPADDLEQAQEVFTSARHDVRRVLEDSRPELEGLAAEGEALRSALRPQQAFPARQARPRREITPFSIDSPAVDFEFSSIGLDSSPDLTLRHRRPSVRTLIAAAATIVGIAAMGTVWWLSGSDATKAASSSAAPQEKATSSSALANPKSVANAKPVANSVAERGATAPDPRFPLSIELAARTISWVRITADGRIVAERSFKPGERQHVAAAREISVRAGDAGALTVSVDGRLPVALGSTGEVVTRRFLVDARRAPPAASTPAPSQQAAYPQPARPAGPIAQSSPQRDPGTTAAAGAPVVVSSAPVRAAEQPLMTAPPPAPFTPAAPPAASTPAPSPSPSERPVVVPAPTSPRSLQDSLTGVASRWLDAYYRQDRATMNAISPRVTVSDNRGEKDRMPRGLPSVQRSLDGVSFNVAGSAAMLTARMTERSDNATSGRMTVSYISHIWTQQRNGEWQLDDVTIASAASVGQKVGR